MGRRLVRWTDIVGALGLVALLVWTPMYLADGHGEDVASDRVVLPPPRDGMRLETVVVVEFANGTRYEIGPWVDVTFDADTADGTNWTATITRHPASVAVGDFMFRQYAAEETVRFVDGRPADAWYDGDRTVEEPNGTGADLVHASIDVQVETHELAWARFDELVVARDAAEAAVQVMTRVPNLDPGDGKAQKAASSVVGRVVRFDDQVLYAANGGDLRRIGVEMGGLFGAQAKDGTLCDIPFREPWTALHLRGSIAWNGTATEGCVQYQWDWYSADWPAPVGFHRELRDADGGLVFQLDMVPKRIVPGDGPPLHVAPYRGDRFFADADERALSPLSDSLVTTRWGVSATGAEMLEAMRADPYLDGIVGDTVGIAGVLWLDREAAVTDLDAGARCEWSSDRPVRFWLSLVQSNASIVDVSFVTSRATLDVGELRWRWAGAGEQAASTTAEVDWWTPAGLVQEHLDDVIASTGASPPVVPWMGGFGPRASWLHHAWWSDGADPCTDMDLGPVGAFVPGGRAPRVALLSGADGSDGRALLVFAEPTRDPLETPTVQTVAAPASAAASASPLEGPFAQASGIAPAAVAPAGAIEVVEMVAMTVGVAGLAAVAAAVAARAFALLRAGGWIPLGALFVRGGDPSRRDAIVTFVAAHPGVTLSEVADGLDLGWGAMLHHVEALRKAGRLVRVADGARVHLFAVDGQAGPASEAERWRHIVTRRPRYADVWNALAARDGVTATELAKTVGRHRTSVSRTLDRLREVGLVESERDGRRVRFQRVD